MYVKKKAMIGRLEPYETRWFGQYSDELDGSVSVGIVWMASVQFLVEATGFALLYSIQSSSGPHPAFNPLGTGSSMPSEKAAKASS
jgi:hypothetical protein